MMSFRNEIDEEIARKEREKVERQAKIQAISEYCSRNNLPFSELEKDKILHPEDYDDWGFPRYFT
jgi:hypothetical protein